MSGFFTTFKKLPLLKCWLPDGDGEFQFVRVVEVLRKERRASIVNAAGYRATVPLSWFLIAGGRR